MAAQITERRITLPHGVTLMTYAVGQGPPLLFLPGSSADFRLRSPIFQSALVEHFALITYEHRGLARSSGPQGCWTMNDYALDSLAVLDAYKVRAAYVVGESFGAMVAQVLLVNAPLRVRAAALCGGSAGGSAGQSLAFHQLMSLEARERAEIYLLHLNAQYQTIKRNDPDRFDAMVSARCAFEASFLKGLCQPDGYARLLEARAAHDCAEALAAVDTTSVLILGGEDDRIAPPENQTALHRLLKNNLLKMFAGGHDFLFSTPGPVDWILDRWIRPSTPQAPFG
jgi:pimeloyl-ACP methyl ester carboxylesterase